MLTMLHNHAAILDGFILQSTEMLTMLHNNAVILDGFILQYALLEVSLSSGIRGVFLNFLDSA
jgi:hypothetical protein